jgi:hypothetical protein
LVNNLADSSCQGSAMAIVIPIPIGVHRIVSLQGAVIKVVDCEYCKSQFGFRLDLEARGGDHDLLFLDPAGSKDRALQQAKENLEARSRNLIVPVPCPQCGMYQEAMGAAAKR